MQIIPRDQSFGALLGSGLGELAGHKLGQLIKGHQQQKERSEFAQTWEPIVGKDSANFLSRLSPDERKYALDNISSLIQLNEPPSAQQQAGELGQKNGLETLQQPMQSKQPAQQQQQITPDKAKLLEDIFASPERKKEKREQEKLALVQRRENLKETKPYIDSLKNKEKAAKEGNLRLQRMENLIKKGNLPNSGLWSFLSKIEELGPVATGAAGAALGHVFPGIGHAVGGIVGALSSPFAGAAKSIIKSGNPDIEEFEKLSNDFVKNAKQYFGSRLTDADLRIFMQTIPTLMQTDAGKEKVIENLKSLNELAEIEAKAARSIIKANGGIPPIDIEQQVQDKIGNKLDKVAKKFVIR